MSNAPKFIRNKRREQREALKEMIIDNQVTTAEVRAMKRWAGAQKILSLISRTTRVSDCIRGMQCFQQKWGF